MDPRQRERRWWREHPESLHPTHNLWPHQLESMVSEKVGAKDGNRDGSKLEEPGKMLRSKLERIGTGPEARERCPPPPAVRRRVKEA